MGKYSDMERVSRDFYPTPIKAVAPLAPFMKDKKYIEPCAGDGRLAEHIFKLQPSSTLVAACDIEPQKNDVLGVAIHERDIVKNPIIHLRVDADCFVTNPPWLNNKESGYQLNTIIKSLSSVLPTWLLLNGNYVFNKKSAECMRMCTDVVPIGRVKWIEGSASAGKEDCAWFRFDSRDNETKMTYIHPRS